MSLFAGKAVQVRIGQRAGLVDDVAEWVVAISCNHGLAAVNHEGDVAVAVRAIKAVAGPVSGGIAAGTSEQTANSSCALERAAQVGARRIADGRRVIGVALLDNSHAIVDVVD